eukprot:391842-Hanusia_phi.AAC.3
MGAIRRERREGGVRGRRASKQRNMIRITDEEERATIKLFGMTMIRRRRRRRRVDLPSDRSYGTLQFISKQSHETFTFINLVQHDQHCSSSPPLPLFIVSSALGGFRSQSLPSRTAASPPPPPPRDPRPADCPGPPGSPMRTGRSSSCSCRSQAGWGRQSQAGEGPCVV